ncbi:hypothetical protein BDZ45DRAFT_727176 [Acephala macrosclerotiorum]|nr:hypothetical protein BDZ45DRAFT_727176 [Acephala macrosclerotiorum]
MSPRDSRSSPDSQSSATSLYRFPRQDDGKNQDREKPVLAAPATIAGNPEPLRQGHNGIRRWPLMPWRRKADILEDDCRTAERSAISSPKERPHTSVDPKSRPRSKSKRLWNTSGGERRSSTHRDQFPSIPGYPKDREIIRLVEDLTASIGQHVERYYLNAGLSSQGGTSLSDLQTRGVLIRKYISQEIIESMIMQSLTNKFAIAKAISRQLAGYANPNENDIRGADIERLSELGDELRGLIKSHNSSWKFGPWENTDLGFITIFPALLKDGEQLMQKQMFRIG